MPKKHSLTIIGCLLSVVLIQGCPKVPDGVPVVTPTPSPTPTQVVSVIPIPSTPPIIVDSLFRVEFGPSSKGVSNFGPSSKGVNNEFGPSSKGVSNLRFNVNFDSKLVRNDIGSFSTQAIDSELKLSDIKLTLQKQGQLIANIDILPKSNNVEIGLDTNIEPGEYDLVAVVNNNFEPLKYSTIVKLESNLELKVILYAKELKREDLDIAIRTKPIKMIQ